MTSMIFNLRREYFIYMKNMERTNRRKRNGRQKMIGSGINEINEIELTRWILYFGQGCEVITRSISYASSLKEFSISSMSQERVPIDLSTQKLLCVIFAERDAQPFLHPTQKCGGIHTPDSVHGDY